MQAAAPGGVIVATKLHIPAPRAGLIERDELVARLLDGAGGKLTLLNAPAGSGKTTLLAAWHAARRTERPFAWVSLDEGDNDAVRFWDYVIEALRNVSPGVGEAPIRVASTHLVAAAVRLRANVSAWGPRTAAAFAAACAERTRELGAQRFVQDAETWARSAAGNETVACADAACVAYIAAHAAGEAGGDQASERERAWQARWLVQRLGLARPVLRPQL
jgi:MoxR-like ATPase